MEYHIDCPSPKCPDWFANANQTTLQAQFVAHMQGHGWTATQADTYFPLNCWERPTVPVG